MDDAAREAKRAAKQALRASRHEGETEEERTARKAAKRAAKEAAAAAAAGAKRPRGGDASAAGAAPAEPAVGRPRTRSLSIAEAEHGGRASPVVSAAAADAAPPRRPRTRSLSVGEAEHTAAAAEASPSARAAAYAVTHNVRIIAPAGFVMPAPLDTFERLPFSPKVLAVCLAAGYTAPTVTQALSWPLALTGSNIVSVAKTGSGKTLGFLLPAFHQLAAGAVRAAPVAPGKPAAPQLLVMAPTRELACQIEVEATKFGRALGLRAACVYGGAPKSLQIRALRAGVDAVIGTPGRIGDLVQMGVLGFSAVRFLVLDEADRMLDMGFEPQIRDIISRCPEARQTLLFTATWPREVQRLAAEFAPRPVQMSLGDTGVLSANADIEQVVEVVAGGAEGKVAALRDFFTKHHMTPEGGVKPDHGKTIVFSKFKAGCARIAQELWDAGFSVNTLHGDMEQRERDRVIGEFRTGKLRVLVATDVAGRGLDVKDVTLVLNFDMAGNVRALHTKTTFSAARAYSQPTHHPRPLRPGGGLRAPHRAHRARGVKGDRAHAVRPRRGQENGHRAG
jgi:ATP-dependent RNA helicase DDX5/DBP2